MLEKLEEKKENFLQIDEARLEPHILHNFCSVCRKKYQVYREHIESEKHRLNSES